jgi:hypothetical protein
MSTEADAVFEKLLDGQKLQSSLSSTLKTSFFINGKTMDSWRKYFQVNVPADNLNPEICRGIASKLAMLYQEASGYYAMSDAELQVMERGSESQYRNKYEAHVLEYKNAPNGKIPSAATLENLAKAGLDTLYSAISVSQIAKNFWKSVLDSLDTTRKLIENMTFNNHIEANLNKAVP